MKIPQKIRLFAASAVLTSIGVAFTEAGTDKPDAKKTKAPVVMTRTEVLEKAGGKAQNKADRKKEPAKSAEVTGSRIKVKDVTPREMMHGASQVEVIDQKRIRQSGRADLLGVLSNLPGRR